MIPNALTNVNQFNLIINYLRCLHHCVNYQEFRRPVSDTFILAKRKRKEEDQGKAEMASVRFWFVVLRKRKNNNMLEPYCCAGAMACVIFSYFPLSLIISCSFSLSCYIKALKNPIQILA